METIARIEEKVENMQTRAEAYQEISMESDKDSLESKFEELEHDSSDMELELLELKKRAALPAPDEESDKKE
jgi:phage shock protein A